MQYAHGGDVYSYRIPVRWTGATGFFGKYQSAWNSADRQGCNASSRGQLHTVLQTRNAVRSRRFWGHARNLPPEAFFCGNGAAEIFYGLVHCIKPRTALLTAPTFGEYEQALCEQGTEIRFHKLLAEEGFGFTSRFLLSLTRIWTWSSCVHQTIRPAARCREH